MKRFVLAVDPGFTQSAFVLYDGAQVLQHGISENGQLLERLQNPQAYRRDAVALVIEQIESMGMAVGREVFETVFWCGRFAEAWASQNYGEWWRLTRRAVKLNLCGTSTAKDVNVRRALIDRFGPGDAAAIGRKAAPGPLYGVVRDEWAALAVAVSWWDRQRGAAGHAPREQQPSV